MVRWRIPRGAVESQLIRNTRAHILEMDETPGRKASTQKELGVQTKRGIRDRKRRA